MGGSSSLSEAGGAGVRGSSPTSGTPLPHACTPPVCALPVGPHTSWPQAVVRGAVVGIGQSELAHAMASVLKQFTRPTVLQDAEDSLMGSTLISPMQSVRSGAAGAGVRERPLTRRRRTNERLGAVLL